MSDMRLATVTAADAEAIAEYRAAFPADRARVTLELERIPGLDHLEEYPDVAAWLAFTQTMAGKITWYALRRTGEERILGMICLRHRLEYDDDEGDFASHVGYSVRPDARRRGCASAMLTLLLPEARRAGIEVLRLICMADNTASQRTIERCGGVYLDALTGEESGLTVYRYDLPTTCE